MLPRVYNSRANFMKKSFSLAATNIKDHLVETALGISVVSVPATAFFGGAILGATATSPNCDGGIITGIFGLAVGGFVANSLYKASDKVLHNRKAGSFCAGLFIGLAAMSFGFFHSISTSQEDPSFFKIPYCKKHTGSQSIIVPIGKHFIFIP